ncbi:HWE histidine kinase domain-containing protein [Sphingomonas mesophila]|uniref:HWE histidine kinase domain-containing protein n=1 Tax=Sphingomonas mesophila TaxID=2303576 RepID=UPI000E5732D1|nr:HWE histidine kinase domain-containing protein [Sphingomonas mesophila]
MNLSWGILHAGLQSVLDTALDAVVVMDTGGRIIGWNDRSTEAFGWTWDEAKGQQLSEMLIPEALRAGHEGGLKHYLATGEGPVLDRRIEVTALHRDGREMPIELSVTACDQFGDKLFIGFLRDISERRAVAERQQRILQESEHRVKNMLTVVAAIAQQTARASSDIASFSEAFSGRLQSLARAHQLLVGQVWNDVALSALAEQVLGGDVAEGRARFGGPEILLGPRQLMGVSMILHELYTNAIKYGSLCAEGGRVELDWSVDGDTVELVWTEVGGSCTAEVPSSGFGQRMIALTVQSDLGGTIERDWRPEGLSATIRFPAANQ